MNVFELRQRMIEDCAEYTRFAVGADSGHDIRGIVGGHSL
jgi:hypothetical protein